MLVTCLGYRCQRLFLGDERKSCTFLKIENLESSVPNVQR